MEEVSGEQGALKKQRLRDFHKRAKLLLNASDRDLLYTNLKRYQREKRLDKLLQCLRAILDTPTKLDLLRDIRAFIPPHQVPEYDREVPYHNMAKPLRAARSLGNLTSPRLYTHAAPIAHEAPSVMLQAPHDQPRLMLEPTTIVLSPQPRDAPHHGSSSDHLHKGTLMLSEPRDIHRIGHEDSNDGMRRVAEWRSGYSQGGVVGAGEVRYSSLPRKAVVPVTLVPRPALSTHNTPQQHRRPVTSGSPEVLVISVHVPYSEELGLSIRGGSEHGLGIFVSEMLPGSPAERSGLRVGDQVTEVNSVQFSSLASASAVTVLTGSERLRLKVRRVGKIPAHKASKEKIAWYDVSSRRTVHADPEDQPGITLPGSLGLRHNERKVHLHTRVGSHLGFNIRGGAEYQLPLYISRTDRGGLAAEHGLKPGDQLMQVNGTDVSHSTHAQCVTLIRASHSLVLTVKDVGMYPAYKDVYTEYKWLDVHTGHISKSRSYKKHTLGGSGTLESIPVLGADDPPGRLQFAESRADGHVDGHVHDDDSDGLDDVMEHLYEPAPFENQWRSVSLSRLRPTLTRSVTDLHTMVPTQNLTKDHSRSEHNLATNLTRRHSRSEQNLAQATSDRQCYVYSKHSPAFYSQQGGEPSRTGSVMESALAFTSLHDIHAASTQTRDVSSDGTHMTAWNSDVTMRERSRGASAESTPKGSVKSKRDKSAPRSSLALRALEQEARQQHPELAAQYPPDKSNVAQSSSESGSKRKRSIRERLFGSKSKNREDSKKHGKQRGLLVEIGFQHQQEKQQALDVRELETRARGVLSEDEVQAVVRHLSVYSSKGELTRLLAPLFAILDTPTKMGLCSSIRSLLRESDRRQFDAVVNQRFDQIELERTASVNTNTGRMRRLSGDSTYSLQSTASTQRRKKRLAPPPPTSSTTHISTSTAKNTSATRRPSLDKSKSRSMSDISHAHMLSVMQASQSHHDVNVHGGDFERSSEFHHPRSSVSVPKHVVVVNINDEDVDGNVTLSRDDNVTVSREHKSSEPAVSTRASLYEVSSGSSSTKQYGVSITLKDSQNVHENHNTVVHDIPQHSTHDTEIQRVTNDNFSMRAPVATHNTPLHDSESDISVDDKRKEVLYLDPAHHNVVVHLSPKQSPLSRHTTSPYRLTHSPSPQRTPSPIRSPAPSYTPSPQHSPHQSAKHSPTALLKHSPLDHAFKLLSIQGDGRSPSPSPPLSPEQAPKLSKPVEVTRASTVMTSSNSLHEPGDSPVVTRYLGVRMSPDISHTVTQSFSTQDTTSYHFLNSPATSPKFHAKSTNSSQTNKHEHDKQRTKEKNGPTVIFIPKSPKFIYKPQARNSKSTVINTQENEPKKTSESQSRISRKESSNSFKGEKPLLNSTMDDLDDIPEPPPPSVFSIEKPKSVIKENRTNQNLHEIKTEVPHIFFIDKSAEPENHAQKLNAIPAPPPPPPLTPGSRHRTAPPSPTFSPTKSGKSLVPPNPADSEDAIPLANILTKSLETKRNELKSVNKTPKHQVFHSAGAVKKSQETNQNTGSKQSTSQMVGSLERTNGNFLVEASKTLERYKQNHTPTISRRASLENDRKADDTISVTSTMTSASHVKADPELAACDYMDSASMFPVYEAPSTLRQNSSFMGNFKTPPAKKRDLNSSQTESVLQATATLDFLDALDTDSQWDSSVVATHGETSGVLTPRSEASDSTSSVLLSSAYQSTMKIDQQPGLNISGSSIGSKDKRAPPTFIAPPPPSEPPPSDDESMSGSECSCTPRSDISSDVANGHSDGSFDDEPPIATNKFDKRGGMVIDSDSESLFGFLSDSKHKDDTRDSAYNDTTIDNTSAEQANNTQSKPLSEPNNNSEKMRTTAVNMDNEVKPRSWLFRKSSARPPTPKEDVTAFFEQPDSPKLSSKDSDRMLVYLDKSHKTLGLSISGGTDSKAQPEIRVKAVFPGGAAVAEGSMKAGMQIVSIDGTHLEGVTHMRAVVTIKRSFDNKAKPQMAVELRP